MLKYRIILGLLFSTLLVGIFFLDQRLANHWPAGIWITPPGSILALAMLLLIIPALCEMRGLMRKQNVAISMRICVVASILCVLWPWISQVASEVTKQANGPTTIAPIWSVVARWFETVKPHYLVPTVLAGSLVGAFVMHTRHQQISGAIANAGGSLLAIVYLGVLPGFFLPICLTHGSWMVLGIIAIVKLADIGAYITGRLLGRHKLIPWLSPGKTIEGFIGGLCFAGAAGVALILIRAQYHSSPPTMAPTTLPYAEIPTSMLVLRGLALGLILGAVGQLGDLLESLLKRDAGVKDSGKVPGFGGILDLLDSPLIAAPVAYWMLKLFGHQA